MGSLAYNLLAEFSITNPSFLNYLFLFSYSVDLTLAQAAQGGDGALSMEMLKKRTDMELRDIV